MGKIIEASELPIDCKVYLTKDMFGYKCIEPWRNPETGKFNWYNFITGGNRVLATTIFIILLTGCLYLGVNELVGVYKSVAANPCAYCSDCHSYVTEFLDRYYSSTRGLSSFNLTLAG